MTKYLILLTFSLSIFANQLSSIRSDLKKAKLLIIGEVLETDANEHLVKVNKWTENELVNSSFVHIKAKRELQRFGTYLFAINDVDEDKLIVHNSSKDIYKIKSLGDYKFIIRNYNSDKPLIGQMSLSSMMNFIKKDLNYQINTRSLTRYEKEQTEPKAVTKNYRSIASIKAKAMGRENTSETWLISLICLLITIPFILRKTRL